MGYRRRWEVLQSSKNGKWTLAEDKALRLEIDRLTAGEYKMGGYGMWVAAAKALDTGRSARDCYWRWSNALRTMHGVKNTPTRLPGIHMNEWSDEESRRLEHAIGLLTSVTDHQEAIRAAEQKEPWLLVSTRSEFNMPRGFWIAVARAVGTRTAQQCRMKVELENERRRLDEQRQRLSTKKKPAQMTVDEVLLLERAVAEHGAKWEYIRKHCLPHIPAVVLKCTHKGCKHLESKYSVRIVDTDPRKMLINYKGGTEAMRRTGADGRYDPGGSVCLVRVPGQESCMTPFRLALLQVRTQKSKPLRRLRPQQFIPAAYRSAQQYPSLQKAEFYDNLIASMAVHGCDWAAVGKDVKLPPFVCYNIAKRIAEITPALKLVSPINSAP
ncbi:hypothetical protein GGI12_003438 [Dipsacomyces acuminosporus]|nr:hypothetical protein GGI12_003438 [Dipsacomyces acuminosporus]